MNDIVCSQPILFTVFCSMGVGWVAFHNQTDGCVEPVKSAKFNTVKCWLKNSVYMWNASPYMTFLFCCDRIRPRLLDSVINLISQITASQSGTFAIYLCSKPTRQLHTLVPDGSKRRLRAQIDCAGKKWKGLEAVPVDMLGRVKRKAESWECSQMDRWNKHRLKFGGLFFESRKEATKKCTTRLHLHQFMYI